MEEFEQYTAKKLTQMQKRGLPAGKGAKREHTLDRPSIEAVKPRPLEELQQVQMSFAGMALEHEDPEAWLADVLEALGLRVRIIISGQQRRTNGNTC
jgi:hypothetical protein